jgi:hypothetical protein
MCPTTGDRVIKKLNQKYSNQLRKDAQYNGKHALCQPLDQHTHLLLPALGTSHVLFAELRRCRNLSALRPHGR